MRVWARIRKGFAMKREEQEEWKHYFVYILNTSRRNKMSVKWQRCWARATTELPFFHFYFGPRSAGEEFHSCSDGRKGKLNFVWFRSSESFCFCEPEKPTTKQDRCGEEETESKPSTNTSATANQQKLYKSKIKKRRRKIKMYPSSFHTCVYGLTTNGSRS